MTKTKLQQVLEILKIRGWSDEQIAQLNVDLTKASAQQFYQEAMVRLSEEDLQEIENAPTDEEANKLIFQRFSQRTGIKPEEVFQKFIDNFTDKFLAEYEADKNNHKS